MSKPSDLKFLRLGLYARIFVAAWNSFFGPSFGAEADAARFHEGAVEFANSIGKVGQEVEFQVGYFYSYVLGYIYHYLTDSLFLGCLISVVAWYYSAKILLKILHLLKIDETRRGWAMAIYSLLPSSILFTGITMREPFQLLCVNVAAYSALKIYLDNSKKHWLYLAFATACMSTLHSALLGFGLCIAVSLVVTKLLRRNFKTGIIKLLCVLPLIAIAFEFGIVSFSTQTYKLDEGLDVAVQSYVEGGLATEARSDYKTSIDIASFGDLVLYLPTSLFQYLFEPMPWKISAVVDIESLLENVLRLFLIATAIRGIKRAHASERIPIALLLLYFLMLETIWSLGTINWGTAARHHIPAEGLLIATAFAVAQNRKNTGTLMKL